MTELWVMSGLELDYIWTKPTLLRTIWRSLQFIMLEVGCGDERSFIFYFIAVFLSFYCRQPPHSVTYVLFMATSLIHSFPLLCLFLLFLFYFYYIRTTTFIFIFMVFCCNILASTDCINSLNFSSSSHRIYLLWFCVFVRRDYVVGEKNYWIIFKNSWKPHRGITTLSRKE